MIVLVSKVTAPVLAINDPWIVAPVVAVTEMRASICPTKVEFVPKVAEEVTCQKTLQACAPFVNCTILAPAVVRESTAVKMKTALGSPFPFNVYVPVKLAAVPIA